MPVIPFLRATAIAILAAAPAAAIPLPPGGAIDLANLDDASAAAISPGDPAWFGSTLGVLVAAAEWTVDGLDGGVEVEDLYQSNGEIRSSVSDVAGSLTFGYVFANATPDDFGNTASFTGAALTGFAGTAIDVAAVGVAFETIGPWLISRSADGDVVTFDFDPFDEFDGEFGLASALSAGDETAEFRFRTDAPAFGVSGATMDLGILDFGVDETAALPGILAPAPIPVPAGLPLLGAGLAALALLRRRTALGLPRRREG